MTNLTAGQVGLSLAGFVVAYTVLSAAFVFFMAKLLRKGPNMDELPPPAHRRGLAAEPGHGA